MAGETNYDEGRGKCCKGGERTQEDVKRVAVARITSPSEQIRLRLRLPLHRHYHLVFQLTILCHPDQMIRQIQRQML